MSALKKTQKNYPIGFPIKIIVIFAESKTRNERLILMIMGSSFLNDESIALIKAMLTLNGFKKAEDKDEWTLKNVPFFGGNEVFGDFTFTFKDNRLHTEVCSPKYYQLEVGHARRETFCYWSNSEWGEPSGIVSQLQNKLGNLYGVWLKRE